MAINHFRNIYSGIMDRALALSVMLVLFAGNLSAQRDTIVEGSEIGVVKVTVENTNPPMRMRGNGSMRISTEYMSELPKILGNGDPMRLMQMMPGIQVNSEYDSGIHIQGCENSHNYLSIDGAPIYNASHLLGFFSIFNPDYFSSVDISKSPNSAHYPGRIGGSITFDSETAQDSLQGVVDVGLISSQAALRIPLGKSQSLMLQARASYMNLLYGSWLSIDDNSLRYNFSDFNARYVAFSNIYNELYIDLYHGKDRMAADGGFSLHLDWGNDVASIHYNKKTGLKWSNMIYLSRYRNEMTLDLGSNHGTLPSGIYTVGAKSGIGRGGLDAGLDIAFHSILPQMPAMETENFALEAVTDRMELQEHFAYAQYQRTVGEGLVLGAGLRGGVYVDQSSHCDAQLMPNLSIRKVFGESSLELQYAMRCQNIFQTGFSSSGLPTECWYPSVDSQYQKAHCLLAGYQTMACNSMLGIQAELYFKRITNQVEYTGSLLDIVTTEYDIANHLISGNGYNYGLGLLVQKRLGTLKGWISYNFGRSMRRSVSESYPSNHDRPHELNIVATYSLGRRWNLGSTFVYASGTPFTAPKYFYILNGNIMSEYGDHNANRLRPYSRLDLSATYQLRKTARCEHSLNFSVYNALAHGNDLFYTLKSYNGNYRYWYVRFMVKTLPSISYHLKF